MKEYDVHFSLNGFFRKVEANSHEEAMTIAEAWLTEARPELEKHARTGLGIEMVEAVEEDGEPTDEEMQSESETIRTLAERCENDRFHKN